MTQEFSRDISFKPQDLPYNCKLCDLTLRYNENLRSVFVVDSKNPDKIIENHNCIGIQNNPLPSMFTQQLDPLEYYQREQSRSAIQQRKDAELEEQKRAEAGRRHLAEIRNRKNDSKNSQATMLKILLEIEQKKVIELEDENTKLRRQNIALKQSSL